jgi:hypothetical protein
MIKPISLKQLFKKDIKTICLSIGGFYAVFGAFAILMIKLQTIMLTNFESSPHESFTSTLKVLHEIWIVYMPLLTILGLGYLAFGFFFNKIKTNKYLINLLLSILCLIWFVAYAISSIRFMDVLFAGMANGFEAFKYILYVFAGIGFVAVFALMTIPQYTIGKKIKTHETENE